MGIKLIAAVGINNEIGRDNRLIWKLQKDMNFFKEMTMGKSVVMGSKTFFSIGGSLPGRNNIVISSKNLDRYYDVTCFNKIDQVVFDYMESQEELFVIGGSSIYEQFMPFAKAMYLTRINQECHDADTYFPNYDEKEWHKKILGKGTENDINYSFTRYVRKRVKK